MPFIYKLIFQDAAVQISSCANKRIAANAKLLVDGYIKSAKSVSINTLLSGCSKMSNCQWVASYEYGRRVSNAGTLSNGFLHHLKDGEVANDIRGIIANNIANGLKSNGISYLGLVRTNHERSHIDYVVQRACCPYFSIDDAIDTCTENSNSLTEMVVLFSFIDYLVSRKLIHPNDLKEKYNNLIVTGEFS